jgi:hypothetical protein
VPLNLLTVFGVCLLLLSMIAGVIQALGRIFFAGSVTSGTTTVLLSIFFFGGINVFAVALVGEYIAKIFEEVKQRPHFIRRSIIRDGELRAAADELQAQRL